jgi:crotonobetainyl-CoA:carnitine CoA-transferase CaiB-like acyl-CoA transferase
VLAGPWCTQLLADLGATVVKIERPAGGDDTRRWGPPFLAGADGREGDAAYYLACNRGKKSVTLDIAKPEGRALARRLALSCDVLVENFKVGDLARHGLDPESLARDNPRLVYCSITGFGQDGPYRDRPGYDFMIQGLGGLMSVTGERDDLPGGGPQKVGVAVSDLMTGMYATSAILASLLEREKTGLGQRIDLALLDVQVAMLANLSSSYFVSGAAPRRMGNAHQNIVPYHVFKASDEFLIVAVGNDSQFAGFCEVIGEPAWPADPRLPPIRSACATATSSWGSSPSGWRSGRRASGWRSSSLRACRAGRSTTSRRCSRTRRCATARWRYACPIRSRARCAWSPIP